MLRRITVALAAALTFSLATTAAQAVDPVRQATATTDASARAWHITGQWKGLRDNTLSFYMRTQLRIWRTDAGRLRGTAVYRSTSSGSVLCRTRLRFLKRTKTDWRVFRERAWYDPNDHCRNTRTRMHKRPNNRLRVYWFDGSGIREEGTLRRP